MNRSGPTTQRLAGENESRFIQEIYCLALWLAVSNHAGLFTRFEPALLIHVEEVEPQVGARHQGIAGR